MSLLRPVSATHRFTCPLGNLYVREPWGLVWDAPGCREAWFAHRLELDQPPDDPEPFFARWDERHAGKGIGRAFLCWETDPDTPWAPIAERFAPVRMHGLARSGQDGSARGAALPIRAVSDLPTYADRLAAQNPEYGPDHPGYVRWWQEGLVARGATVVAAFVGDLPVAGATVVPGPDRGYRFQEVWTDRAWRRLGLCTAVVDHVLRLDPEGTFVIASVDGSDALRIYERAGFRRVSRFVECSRPIEHAVTSPPR